VAVARRRRSPRPRSKAPDQPRYTVDASVFVNAFNPNEDGHAQSLAFLAELQESADPVIVPVLLLPEVASAVARATDDSTGALEYASATAALPHLTLIPLSPTMARQAAELAAAHRLRGADAVYVAVARRYGTSLVSRDEEQRRRGSAAVTCQTPEDALASRSAAGSVAKRLGED
jgi:predicted nucleic acid-binding protein